MRTTSLLCSALILAFVTGAQQQTRENCAASRSDPYSVNLVISAFNYFRDHKGGFEGEIKPFVNNTPSLPELGDSVSIAILKSVKPSELIQPQSAYAFLAVVSLAFSYRNRVSQEADKDPKVTLFLLDYLQEKESSDPTLATRIDLIKTCVQDFSCRSAIKDATHSP